VNTFFLIHKNSPAFETQEAMKEHADGMSPSQVGDFLAVEVTRIGVLDRGVRVLWPDAPPTSVKTPARKPRAAKAPDLARVEALRTAIMPGEEYNMAQLSLVTGKHADDLRHPLGFLMDHGEVQAVGKGRGKRYRAIPGAARAAVPADKVAVSP